MFRRRANEFMVEPLQESVASGKLTLKPAVKVARGSITFAEKDLDLGNAQFRPAPVLRAEVLDRVGDHNRHAFHSEPFGRSADLSRFDTASSAKWTMAWSVKWTVSIASAADASTEWVAKAPRGFPGDRAVQLVA